MIYLGIDPGLDGGIAGLKVVGDSQELFLVKTPVIGGRDYDVQAMKEILRDWHKWHGPSFTTIENQVSMPGQGLTSTLQTGKGFGIWLGLLAALEMPFQVIQAASWQRKMFTGVKGTLDTKEKSEVIAKRLFPGADFRRSERATKASDGLTDAACIAEFGRRTHATGVQGSGIPHTPMEGVQDVCGRCGRYIPSDELGCIPG